jgi:hypothetical protein
MTRENSTLVRRAFSSVVNLSHSYLATKIKKGAKVSEQTLDKLKIYFRIDKDLIHSGEWARMSKAEKSVYPVLGRHADQRGTTFVAQETVAKEAGTTRQRVGRATKALAQRTGLGFNYTIRLKDIRKIAYSYILATPPTNHPNAIRFYKELIDEGYWAEMSASAHSVYVAMRGMATKVEENDANWVKAVGEEVLESYKVPYVKVKANKTKIARLAGVSTRKINNALKELMHIPLIKPLDYDQEKMLPTGEDWMVYLLPVYSPSLIENRAGFDPEEFD